MPEHATEEQQTTEMPLLDYTIMLQQKLQKACDGS